MHICCCCLCSRTNSTAVAAALTSPPENSSNFSLQLAGHGFTSFPLAATTTCFICSSDFAAAPAAAAVAAGSEAAHSNSAGSTCLAVDCNDRHLLQQVFLPPFHPKRLRSFKAHSPSLAHNAKHNNQHRLIRTTNGPYHYGLWLNAAGYFFQLLAQQQQQQQSRLSFQQQQQTSTSVAQAARLA